MSASWTPVGRRSGGGGMPVSPPPPPAASSYNNKSYDVHHRASRSSALEFNEDNTK